MAAATKKIPEGGVFALYDNAVVSARNLMKAGVRLEVTSMSKRSSSKTLGDLSWEAYQRHVDFFCHVPMVVRLLIKIITAIGLLAVSFPKILPRKSLYI